MKKRFFAALLSFIMVFSLLPLNALAVNRSVPLTLNVSSYSAPFINGNTGEHTVGWYKALKYISRSAVGSDNASGSATARFEGSNETGWTLVIDVVVGNYKETWTTNARITNKDMSAATGSVTFGLSFNTSGGTSTNIIISGAKDLPAKPSKPSGDDIKNLLGENVVKVDCINTSVNHADQTYPLLDGSFTVGDVQGSAGSYTCTVTVKAEKYVGEYNQTISGHSLSTTDTTPKSITLAYNGTKWVAPTDTPIVFKVVCDATPADPELGENFVFSADKMVVKFICETTIDHNDSYGLKNGYYSVSDKKKSESGKWRCAIEINLNKYFADFYSKDHPGHIRTNPKGEISRVVYYLDWNENLQRWTASERLISATEIHVKCDAVTPPMEPSKEDIKELLGSNAVQIICTNRESGHGSKTFGLIDDTFSVRYDGQYTCEVTIGSFYEYVEEFNTELNVAQGTHFSDTSKADQSIINLRWVNGAWTAVDTPAKHHVLCVTPKYTVTYTDGVANGASFTEQKHENLLSGVATPAWVGTADKPVWEDHVFAGWEPEVAPTVTGNATYVAQWKDDKNNNGTPDDEEEKYTVTYTDGAANGASFTEQKHENLLSGVATPAWVGTADKPVWEDHVFAGWEPEVAPTVTGNATYVAQWKDDKNNNGTPDDEEEKYTVTYTDGAANGASFTEQKHENLLSGVATPAWVGTADKPVWEDHVFAGWEPEVAPTVTGNATYAAQWKDDKNNNGIPDENEDKYTVTYTDGVDGEVVFADQVYDNLLSGTTTPAFKGTPTRDGYVFAGWKPEVAEKVTENATYAAQWTARTDLSYTVHYYLKNTTKQVANDKRVNGQTFNAVVEEEAIRISGYRVYGDSVKSITIGTGTNDIIFYYTRTYHPSTPSKPTLNTGDHYAYVMGYPDGTVRPNGSITRAEVSAILFRLLSDKTRDEYFTTESSFTDVKAGAWYNNSIATLEKAGVIVDTAKGGAFRPNEAITRAELAAMLAQFSDAKPVKGVKFSDVPAEHWAYEAIAIAAKMGWIEGYPDGTFRPDATITRAEMMTLVNRALERVPSDEDHLLSKRVMLTFPDCKSGDWFYIAVQEATNSHTYERAATEKNGDEQWTALRANRDWTLLEK